MSLRSAVIVFPGSNCDRDVAVALEQSTGQAPLMVWHKESDFPEVDLMVLPGGFSYGDYLRCGAMAAQSPVVREVKRRAEAGVPTLGICNGFQVLTEMQLLPGALLRNAALNFVCRDVTLCVENTQTLFTHRYASDRPIRIPVAHHDGNYYADDETLQQMTDNGQIAFRYVDEDGEATAGANPNGSLANIAGVFNRSKTVLGLMPHPERLSDPLLGGNDGRALFDGLVEALQ